MARDQRDHYYRKAKEEGYRARSAYKLLQINEKFHIIKKGDSVVDLGLRLEDGCRLLASYAAARSWAWIWRRSSPFQEL